MKSQFKIPNFIFICMLHLTCIVSSYMGARSVGVRSVYIPVGMFSVPVGVKCIPAGTCLYTLG